MSSTVRVGDRVRLCGIPGVTGTVARRCKHEDWFRVDWDNGLSVDHPATELEWARGQEKQ